MKFSEQPLCRELTCSTTFTLKYQKIHHHKSFLKTSKLKFSLISFLHEIFFVLKKWFNIKIAVNVYQVETFLIVIYRETFGIVFKCCVSLVLANFGQNYLVVDTPANIFGFVLSYILLKCQHKKQQAIPFKVIKICNY